jgi:hypothetical protein
MSQLGHKQTLRDVRAMSALPPKADISWRDSNVRFVPCMDGARGAREKSDLSAKRSGAAMYSAFECGRFGRWP